MSARRITVCGVGAVGGNLVEHLARTGWTHLHAVDFDRVEGHNIGNQPYQIRQVGQSKVHALASLVYEATGLALETTNLRIDKKNVRRVVTTTDLVVDALDNAQARRVVAQACHQASVPCLHVGLGAHGLADVRPNEGYRIEDPQPGAEACEATESRPAVLLAVILAAETLERWSQELPLAARSLSVPELIVSSRRGIVGSPVEALTEYSRSPTG